MNTFFSFLRRKTDFFTGADINTITGLVNKVITKQYNIAKSDKEKAEKEKADRLAREKVF